MSWDGSTCVEEYILISLRRLGLRFCFEGGGVKWGYVKLLLKIDLGSTFFLF